MRKILAVFAIAAMLLGCLWAAGLAENAVFECGSSFDTAATLDESCFGKQFACPNTNKKEYGWYTFTAPATGTCYIRLKGDWFKVYLSYAITDKDGKAIEHGGLGTAQWTLYKFDVQAGERYYFYLRGNSGIVGNGDWAGMFSVCFDGYHKPNAFGTVLSEPTCTSEGQTAYLCELCNEPVTVETVPAKGHRPGTEGVIKEATCLETGLWGSICLDCGEIASSVEIPLAAHTPGQYVDTREATCTAEGVRTQYCSVCNATINTESVPAFGHSFGEWVVISERSLFSEGERQRTCQYCGAQETEKF